MPVIKRYPNRKLYDTAARQYVSLERVADLIRSGGGVTVIDHATGEDVTAIVLAQVIAEQTRQPDGFLPSPVLAGLVQAGGYTLAGLRRALEAPLDLPRLVDEEIERRIAGLVSRGDLAEEEGASLMQKLAPSPLTDESAIEELTGRDLPSRDDLAELSGQLDRLAADVDELLSRRAAADHPS